MHIGHNDQFKGQSVESTISDIENIIDILQADNPSVTILLAQIINPNFGHAWWDRLNALIPGVASGKTTVNSTVVAVDMNAKFVPSTMTYDKIHPNDKGNEIIAEAWYAAYVSVMVPLGNAYHIDPDNTVGSMKLKIYPNPSDKNDVTIEYNLPSTYGVRIEIINETGKPVKTLTPGKQNCSIQNSLSGYAPGMYFFRLIAGDKRYVEK